MNAPQQPTAQQPQAPLTALGTLPGMAAAVEATVAPPAQPAPAQSQDDPTKPPPWLKGRLEEEANKATSRLLKSLGLDSVEALQGRLQKATELEQAAMTESERREAELKTLREQAQAAEQYRKLSADLAEQQFATLPPHQQAALLEMDPLARIPFITAFRKAEAAAQASPGTPAPVAPQQPARPPIHNVPPGTPPQPAGAIHTDFDRWRALPAGSIASKLFYQANTASIEASRPRGS